MPLDSPRCGPETRRPVPRSAGDPDAKDTVRRRPGSAGDARRRGRIERARYVRARRQRSGAHDTVIDNAPTDDSTGDTLGFGNTIYDASNTKIVGSDGGGCVRTVPGVSWECTWTTSLENGQITVEGPFLDAGDSTLAITGGTGAYRNASGTMDLHARDELGTEYDFTFHLLDD
jgi:hypothetical protein